MRQVYRYKESNRVNLSNLSNLSNLYNLSIKRVALWYETPKPATLGLKMTKRVAYLNFNLFSTATEEKVSRESDDSNILLEVVVSGANKTY